MYNDDTDRFDAEEAVGLLGLPPQSDELNPHCPTLHQYYQRVSEPL